MDDMMTTRETARLILALLKKCDTLEEGIAEIEAFLAER